MENLESRVVEKMMSIGYKEKLARDMAVDLIASAPIREPLLHWIKTGEEMDCVCEDVSALALMRERNYTYPNALDIISLLHRDPERARYLLSMKVCKLIGRK
ncbi:MAG: hypothetical protein FWC97_04285 [Treponema sp.]|nr:hypothetical protein [Treponema sp.]